MDRSRRQAELNLSLASAGFLIGLLKSSMLLFAAD
jgi:hypothetical protein